MFKKFVALILFVGFIKSNISVSIVFPSFFSQKEFDQKCMPCIQECEDILNDKKKDRWNVTLDNYISKTTKKEVPRHCCTDQKMLQLIQSSRKTVPGGLDLYIERKKMDMYCLPKGCYDRWISTSNLKNYVKDIEVSIQDAKLRLDKRKEQIDLLNKNSYDSVFGAHTFFIPKTKKVAAVSAILTASQYALTCTADQTKKDITKKPSKFKKIFLPALTYIASTKIGNTIAYPPHEFITPLLDEEYKKYERDYNEKVRFLADYLAAISGGSAGYSLTDNLIKDYTTLSGLPLSKEVNKYGIVVVTSKSLQDIWPQYIDWTFYSQADLYDNAVRDFGKEFVETGDSKKGLKLRTKGLN